MPGPGASKHTYRAISISHTRRRPPVVVITVDALKHLRLPTQFAS